MSDETPDTTGLREAVNIRHHWCGQTQPHGSHEWQTPSVYGAATFIQTYQCGGHLAAHPSPDASPDPAVVTPDAGDVEALWQAIWRTLADHQWGNWECSCGGVRKDSGVHEDNHLSDVLSDALASHVAAAREADRAEVERLREAGRAQMLDVCLLSEERRSRAEAAEERLAGLVAKVDGRIAGPDLLIDGVGYVSVDRLRALIPADAATALDAVKAEARAAERERIAQAIEAKRVPARRDNTQGQIDTREALDLAARIARHTPEEA